MCAYDAAEQESGVYKLVRAGMVRGGVVGGYAAIQDINENRNIFDREKCVRNSDAICDVLAIQAQNRNRHAKPRMHGTIRRGGVQNGAIVRRSSSTNTEVQVAVDTFMASPISNKSVQKTDTVARIVNKFGGGSKHSSLGQNNTAQNNVKEVPSTPKRKVNLLFDDEEKSQLIITTKLSTCKGGRAGESPAKIIKLCSLRSFNSDNG